MTGLRDRLQDLHLGEWMETAIYGPERMVVLEWALALSTTFVGLWILSPWWPSFSVQTYLLRLGEPVIGAVMALQGWRHTRALAPPVSTRTCRRQARLAGFIWATIASAYVLTPPHTLVIVPICSAFAGMAGVIWLRLWLRFE